MKKCILFGAGMIGNRAWFKLKDYYNIIAYCDNKQALWGGALHGIPIISPEELKGMEDVVVVICNGHCYNQIAEQLREISIEDILIIEPTGYMLYTYTQKEMMLPVRLPVVPIKRSKPGMHILFVQDFPCIRTHRVASILHAKGIEVSIAYTADHPEILYPSFNKIYTQIVSINSINDLISFVNQSDIDLVHSSNAPDDLTAVLLLTNKKIVHDTHDMMTVAYKTSMDIVSLEYIANIKAHGNIYTSEALREIAIQKFDIPREKTFVMENRSMAFYKPKEYLTKLSAIDGELHCVYEGGISPDKDFQRYFEDIWMKLAHEGIHVHFYSWQHVEYCKKLDKKSEYLHYEGHLNTLELITAMTQYDCGLLLFNLTYKNRKHLEVSSFNKIYEYLCAGLPEAVVLDSQKEFVEKYHIGAYVDLNKNIKEQIKKISQITIERDFLHKNKLELDDYADDLIAFYKKAMKR